MYSGGADLILINAWLTEHGEPTIDWESTFSVQLPDAAGGDGAVPLSVAIERISEDLERGSGAEGYGLVDTSSQPAREGWRGRFARDVLIARRWLISLPC